MSHNKPHWNRNVHILFQSCVLLDIGQVLYLICEMGGTMEKEETDDEK